MELKHREKFLLVLYLEYFDKEYDVSDDRIINVGRGFLNRHVEMQNICYLMQCYNIYLGEDYGFVWNYTGPYSDGLSFDQNILDTKQVEINAFYKEYYDRRCEWATNYSQQLQSLLKEHCTVSQSNKIAFSSFVLEHIMKFENGSMVLAGILYLHKTVLPSADKIRVFEELEKRFGAYGIQIDRELEEIVWRNSQIIGLIDVEKKYPIERQKAVIVDTDNKSIVQATEVEGKSYTISKKIDNN